MNRQERLNINRAAWDAYQADYMQFNLKGRPDFFERIECGDVLLDAEVVELAGNVAGLDLLDICCASDAKQAFSWANLGARVTACDIAPTAVEIASCNALRLGLDITFHVADAQTLEPVSDESQDMVFATYLGWFEDIELAVRTWARVLRPGGRLLIDIDRYSPYWESSGSMGSPNEMMACRIRGSRAPRCRRLRGASTELLRAGF